MLNPWIGCTSSNLFLQLPSTSSSAYLFPLGEPWAINFQRKTFHKPFHILEPIIRIRRTMPFNLSYIFLNNYFSPKALPHLSNCQCHFSSKAEWTYQIDPTPKLHSLVGLYSNNLNSFFFFYFEWYFHLVILEETMFYPFHPLHKIHQFENFSALIIWNM